MPTNPKTNELLDTPNKISLSLILVLGCISALTPFAIDMYLPAMPAMAKNLGVGANKVQITLTAYTIGFSIGQLVYGPLADSYGRRRILLSGTLFFTFAAVICALANSIDVLIYIRILQGFTGAAVSVVVQTIIRDMFHGAALARVMSFVLLVMSLAPLVSPIIGGHLTAWLGWRSIFWTLASFAILVMVLTSFKIPETLPAKYRQPLKVQTVLRNYISVISNSSATGLMLANGFSFAGMFAFFTAGPFVYIDLYGLTPKMYGYLYGLNITGMIIVNGINGFLLKRLRSQSILRLSLCIQLMAGIGLLAAWLSGMGLWGNVLFVVLYFSTRSTIASNSMGLLLSDYPHMAGTVSSLAGTFRFGTSSLIGFIVAAMPSGFVWPMVLTMSLCALLSALFYWTMGRQHSGA